ncbi:ultraviolet-B receptor UVR8-like [Iris pallida]|uniref:Ultraviolet-B receptor UVR8-like n=1 Tax=Iris pallida TaxID=29817 RepID=A0AAX6DM58_IRIPA|nr:ultraviolet-B receptor UVR8-like [Iris pallida]
MHHHLRRPSSFLRRLSTTTTSSFIYTHPESQSTHQPSSTVQILTWGRGSSGQLGGGKEEIRFYPTLLSSLLLPRTFSLSPTPGRLPAAAGPASGVEVGVSCGLFHSAALVDGRVWVWGKGDGGRLGLGDERSLFEPSPNPNLEDVRSLALGGLHSAALTRAGEALTWGYGGFGALGHSVYHRELLPRLVNGPWNGTLSHLATSGAHTAAVTDSGELYTWGRDEGDGRLGLGSGGGPGEGGSLGIPSKVKALPVPVVSVCCGGFFTMVLTAEGQLWNWGANSNFELGRGNNVSSWRPQPIPSLQDVRIIQIAAGGYHCLALTEKGEVLSWGHGGHGQLGHGSTQKQKVPLAIEALAQEHIVYIACGGSSSAAISDKGKLFMWGNAGDCQLGVPGLPEVQSLPVEVKFLMDDDEELGSHHVLSVAVGASHAMCLVSRQPSHA